MELTPEICWQMETPHADEDDAADPWGCEVAVGSLLDMLLGFEVVLNLVELGDRALFGADLLENLQCAADASVEHQPTWTLGHGEHTEPEDNGGQGRNREHVAPDVPRVTEGDAEDRVEDEGEELACDDHQLVLRYHASASVGGRHLGEIGGNGDGGTADGKSEDEAAGDEDGCRRGDGTAECRKEEDDGEDEEHPAAPLCIGDSSAEERADCRPEEQPARDEALHGRRQIELIGAGHVGERTVDDTGVVAEEKSAEG